MERTSLKELLLMFLKYIETEKNYSQKTLSSYTNDLTKFFEYLEKEKIREIENIDKELAIKKIDEHLKVLNDDYRVEREEALKNLYIDILPTHVFYDFMEKTGKIGGATKFPRVLKGKRYEEWKQFISSLNN